MDKFNQNQDYGIDVFDNDIEACLDLFCRQYKIKDMRKESQGVWNAALMYIRKMVFPDRKILKSNNLLSNNSAAATNCNAYNYELLDHIADVYIYLSMINDKEVSINGFTYLTGVPRDLFNRWGNGEIKLSNLAKGIYQKLSESRVESLSGKLATGKQNPVGVIAILNHFYGWASPYTADSNRHREALTAADLPRLQTEESPQIEDKRD